MHPVPPPSLTDGRIVVRQLRPHDAVALRAAIVASVDHLRPWMAWAAEEPLPLEAKETLIAHAVQRWDAGEDFMYTITFADDETTIVGGSGLHRRLGPGGLEIGYWVRVDCTGRGVATAAARLLTTASLQLAGIDRVEIHHDRANAASAAVPRRLGFRLVDERPDEVEAPGEEGIECRWRMDAQTWAEVQNSIRPARQD